MNSILTNSRKQILVAGLALASTLAFSQKREINRAERALKSTKYSEVLSLLSEAEATLGDADNDLKAQYYVLKGSALMGAGGASYERALEAGEAYSAALKLKPSLEKELMLPLDNVRTVFINEAVKNQNAGNYEAAAEKLINSYRLINDADDLYYAAGNMVNAGSFDKALEYYEQLLEMGYTGEVTEIVATDKSTGEVVVFDDESTRNLAIRTGEYIKPDTRKTASRKGEILRNITLIYIQEGKNDKAMEVMETARAENPDDVYLMRAEADMSYRMGDFKKYNKLMNAIVATDPDNPEVYFNLGVGSQELGENDQAITYYKKAIELNPNYEAALINLSVIKLAREGELVEEMNSLGMSAADNRRYEELKLQRENLYKEVLPYLEKAGKINPNNIEVMRTLMNIYSQLGNEAKYNAMKSKVDSLAPAQED